MVRIWTHQHPAALKVAAETGRLTGSHAFRASGVAGEELADRYLPLYEWMRDRMAERTEGFSGDLPVWAWAARPSGRRQMAAERESHARVCALVPRRRILASDFGLWESAMQGWPVCLDEAEWEARAGEADRVFREGGEAAGWRAFSGTWERIFDVGKERGAEQAAWLGGFSTRDVQLCVDGIRIEEIVHVRDAAKIGAGRSEVKESFRNYLERIKKETDSQAKP